MTKNFFVSAWQSSADFNFYRKIVSQSFFATFKYLLMLVLIIGVVITIKYYFYLNRGISEATEWAKTNLPDIEIANGEVSVKEQQPIFIEKIPDFIFIIDTTGTVTSIEPKYKRGILLTKNSFIYKESEQATRSYGLSNLAKGGMIKIDDKNLDRLRAIIKRLSFPFLLTGLVVYYLIAKLVQIVVFSLVAVIMNKIINGKLNYRSLVNIGAYAITPVTLLATVIILSGIFIPFFWVLYFLAYVTFLIFAVTKCGNQPRKQIS